MSKAVKYGLHNTRMSLHQGVEEQKTSSRRVRMRMSEFVVMRVMRFMF